MHGPGEWFRSDRSKRCLGSRFEDQGPAVADTCSSLPMAGAWAGGSGSEGPAGSGDWEGDVVAATRALRPQEGTERDWEIFRATVTMAWEEGFDTLPMGEAMVGIGLSFVGTPYAPGTLEVAGEEAWS